MTCFRQASSISIGRTQIFEDPGVSISTVGALGDPSQGVATGGKCATVESSVLANGRERDLLRRLHLQLI